MLFINFFKKKVFLIIHTPIISTSDCEGAGEMFNVTTLDLNNLPRDSKGEIDFKRRLFWRKKLD
jgi:asparaginyl-tRNA synthetase